MKTKSVDVSPKIIVQCLALQLELAAAIQKEKDPEKAFQSVIDKHSELNEKEFTFALYIASKFLASC